jgi:hypothetical protein
MSEKIEKGQSGAVNVSGMVEAAQEAHSGLARAAQKAAADLTQAAALERQKAALKAAQAAALERQKAALEAITPNRAGSLNNLRRYAKPIATASFFIGAGISIASTIAWLISLYTANNLLELISSGIMFVSTATCALSLVSGERIAEEVISDGN